MNTRLLLPLLFAALALTACSQPAPKKIALEKPTIRLTLIPLSDLHPGKSTMVLAKLNLLKNAHIQTNDELQTTRGEKFHLLVIDPSFTDFHYIVPKPTNARGIYNFSFTPKFASYRAWADITPIATGIQEFAAADIGTPKSAAMIKTERSEAMVDNYRFTLSFDKPPAIDEISTGKITITDKRGANIAIGATTHIVGFYDDFRSVLHTDATATNNELSFSLTPKKAGFLKLFAQTAIGGKEVLVPFTIAIQDAPKKK